MYFYKEKDMTFSKKIFRTCFVPVNPLPGVETNDDWVVWLTVILIYLISEKQFCCVLNK